LACSFILNLTYWMIVLKELEEVALEDILVVVLVVLGELEEQEAVELVQDSALMVS